jgi:hypothetical protein
MENEVRQPVRLEDVRITDQFWGARLTAHRLRGLDAVYQQLRKTGRLNAYRLDWTPESEKPAPHVFWDSDVAKWLEGACYHLITHPDAALQVRVAEVVNLILSAQGEDGYLNPHFTVVEPGQRWTNLRDRHELYCAGHLIEAAIAHHRATGERHFLDGIRRYVDLIDRTFGREPGKLRGYPGHEEIELALVKLFRYTGEPRYLSLASYFIHERGQSPHYFDLEAVRRGESPEEYWAGTHAYSQSHRPVREQREVVGHAVRGMYLYSAMADLAAETGDEALWTTLVHLWEDLTAHKLYLTGGIGPSGSNEGFTTRYDLPNQTAYAETCAAIGLVLWARRMLSLDLDRRYADVMERALYNGLLSGISLEGDRYFYVNPLASQGEHHRQPFYACSCCPTNLNRFLPAMGELIYSQGENDLAVHLYIGSEANVVLSGERFRLIQQTDYPWDGVVCLKLEMDHPLTFSLKLRWPGWCQEGRVYLNGEAVMVEDHLERGYLHLDRMWAPGDDLRLQFVMPVRRLYAHPDVGANVNRAAIQRGPLVYCLEGMDQTDPVSDIRLPRGASFESRFEPDLLGGIMVISTQARAVDPEKWGNQLYGSSPPELRPAIIRAIPYYAWDNRQPGSMIVWIPEAVG